MAPVAIRCRRRKFYRLKNSRFALIFRTSCNIMVDRWAPSRKIPPRLRIGRVGPRTVASRSTGPAAVGHLRLARRWPQSGATLCACPAKPAGSGPDRQQMASMKINHLSDPRSLDRAFLHTRQPACTKEITNQRTAESGLHPRIRRTLVSFGACLRLHGDSEAEALELSDARHRRLCRVGIRNSQSSRSAIPISANVVCVA